MSDHDERVRPEIKFISPNGDEFTAKWKNSTRSKSKKLAKFDYPNVVGTLVQDQDTTSPTYPLTFWFDGQTHDIQAERFWIAFDLRGKWEVIHPVHGLLELQPSTIEISDDPTGDSLRSRVDTEWIKSIDESRLISTAELNSIIDAEMNALNVTGSDQLIENINIEQAGPEADFKNSVGVTATQADSLLGPIARQNTEVFAQFNAVQSSLQDALQATVTDPLLIAAQIQNLIQLPSLAIKDIASRLQANLNFATSLFGLTPSTPSVGSRNTLAVQEIALTAVIAANAQIVSTGALKTRPEAINAALEIADQLTAITENLDAGQTIFDDSDIDAQYFSQSQSYASAVTITADAIRLLQQSTFDLLIEKRFKLKSESTPARVVIEQYGTLGEDDKNWDLFIESNELNDIELLLLPPGKELVVYV